MPLFVIKLAASARRATCGLCNVATHETPTSSSSLPKTRSMSASLDAPKSQEGKYGVRMTSHLFNYAQEQ
jgi:hypothetical protein